MRVDISHLVFEALCDADNHVLDDGANGAQTGDAFARAVVHFDEDHICLGPRETDREVVEVFHELACGMG